MKQTEIEGVFKKENYLFTENPTSCRGIKVYNEQLISYQDKEFRSWNPYRSKLAAAILKGLKNIKIKSDSKVLYLGAATGTTVSHISDILKNGVVFAVESSPIALKKLLMVSEKRKNIVPILSDANHPEQYSTVVSSVDLVYQDISQRNQAEIFIKNLKKYLKKEGQGIMMVKARSIDVSSKPKEIYNAVISQLKKHGFNVIEIIDLSPYERDHAAILVTP
ncbi:MAG: fibrillarin-like rRNA/tRNA 2'-O-methyltransferase [Candidatus Thermoplasmatota archaeon]|jgi:fibrillarin-like pre-rRNA processing protein|nr:fibrillarin-like rRNA/tRNA 2'-O-methyltransferase [Candidatus Thermoplasmatota archaeon]